MDLPIDINSLDWKNKLIYNLSNSKSKFIIFNIYSYSGLESLSECEKYTFEIICYGYIHLLPYRYILKTKIIKLM